MISSKHFSVLEAQRGLKRRRPEDRTHSGESPHHGAAPSEPAGSPAGSLLQLPQISEQDPEGIFFIQHIGGFLLPDARALEAQTDADARQALLKRGTTHCQAAGRVSKLWQQGMREVMNRLGAVYVRTRLSMEPPKAWELGGRSKANTVDASGAPDVLALMPADSHMAQRIESLMLQMTTRPRVFIRLLGIVLHQGRELAASSKLPYGLRTRLMKLPHTALAMLYTRGLTQEPGLFPAVAEVMLQQAAAMDARNARALLLDLLAVLDSHYRGQLQDLRERVQQALSLRPGAPSAQERQRSERRPTLAEKKQMIDQLLECNVLLGPHGLRELSWMARNWTESELMPHLSEALSFALIDAVDELDPDQPFAGAFLFDQFPLALLTEAFFLMGKGHQARLLQLEHDTPTGRHLMLAFFKRNDEAAGDYLPLLERLRWRPKN